MKAILISIKPKYVADILNGKKTIEIRKTKPNVDLPIDVYIYCTKDKKSKVFGFANRYPVDFITSDRHRDTGLSGYVVAKFTLNKVEEVKFIMDYRYGGYYNTNSYTNEKCFERDCCLTIKELDNYINKNNLNKRDNVAYAWHISNLVIFDKPKELSEFYKVGFDEAQSDLAMDLLLEDDDCPYEHAFTKLEPQFRLTKAPQSWCYVEEQLL